MIAEEQQRLSISSLICLLLNSYLTPWQVSTRDMKFFTVIQYSSDLATICLTFFPR